MMRRGLQRVLCLALCCGLLPLVARAEIACQCGQTPCACFVQQGDTGPAVEAIRQALVAQGYLKDGKGSDFDENTAQAVRSFQAAHELDETGMLDDETLTLLLWGETPEALSAAQPLLGETVVWIPVVGGKKRHATPTCSGMEHPRLVTVRNAEAMGMEPCKRCKPQ